MLDTLRTCQIPQTYVGALCRPFSGVVKPKRSIWRLKTITDFFRAIINFINVFFMTMFSMEI
ncbi:putative selenoprotein SelK/SelG [Helianthus annuus]|nr:putative selenoprotein SelK/SelG [Helianthus annuus]